MILRYTAPAMAKIDLPRSLRKIEMNDNYATIVKAVEPLMAQVFDYKALLAEIDAFPNTSRISVVQLSRLVNVSILLQLSMKRTRGVPLS